MAFFGTKKPNQLEIGQRLSSYNLPTALQEALFKFLSKAQDAELYRVNPRMLAKQMNLNERQTLDLLAVAVREGVFGLNWEVQCPACTFQASYFDSLKHSRHQIKCIACKTEFDAHFDDHVQVTFTVHPNIRSLPKNLTSPTDVMSGFLKMKTRDAAFKPFTAHELLTVQTFRDLFKSETLPDGESFEVRRVAMLFTDLAGSTALYSRRGDPNAYNLVREHFDLLHKVIDGSRGAVVKTIGDAVMAAFTSEAQALRAAVLAQREIQNFNHSRQLSDSDKLALKIGLHAGPGLYVTLNERLDYFGSTINTAARIESQARPGEIVITEAILLAPGVRELLAGYPLASEEVQLKGLDGKTRLWRIHSDINNLQLAKDRL